MQAPVLQYESSDDSDSENEAGGTASPVTPGGKDPSGVSTISEDAQLGSKRKRMDEASLQVGGSTQRLARAAPRLPLPVPLPFPFGLSSDKVRRVDGRIGLRGLPRGLRDRDAVEDDLASDPLGAVFSGSRALAVRSVHRQSESSSSSAKSAPAAQSSMAAPAKSSAGSLQTPAHGASSEGQTAGPGKSTACSTSSTTKLSRRIGGAGGFVPSHVRRKRAAVSTVDLEAIGAKAGSGAASGHT